MLDFAILGLLREEPRHGYELKRALGDLGFWQVSFGSLYPALRRLEKGGFIEATKGEGRRKAYRITETGPRSHSPRCSPRPATARTEDSSCTWRSSDTSSHSVASACSRLAGRRFRIDSTVHGAPSVALGAARENPDRYRMALMERRVRSTEADIAWLDELIAGERGAAAGA